MDDINVSSEKRGEFLPKNVAESPTFSPFFHDSCAAFLGGQSFP